VPHRARETFRSGAVSVRQAACIAERMSGRRLPNADVDANLVALATEILRYLHAHPAAKDSIDGISRWWLSRDRGATQARVERAIEYLKQHQLVTEHPVRAGPKIYSFRRPNVDQIKQEDRMAESMSSYEATAEQIARDRRDLEEILLKRSSIYPVLVEQMKRVYGEDRKDGGLSQTHKILIAVAMAVQSGTKSSLEWTITRAVNHGATDQMIRDAIDVALLNGGTFAVSNARFAVAALDIRRRIPRKS
jgi:alkylhydroperoxidase/carboxymuconolactone decarboxylase family protein YurZ